MTLIADSACYVDGSGNRHPYDTTKNPTPGERHTIGLREGTSSMEPGQEPCQAMQRFGVPVRLLDVGMASAGRPDIDVDEAFTSIYESCYSRFVALARLTTGSDALAEEIVQDAFLELYRRFAEVSVPQIWLRCAVMSRCTSWVRRRRLERRHELLLDAEPVATDPDVLVFRSLLDSLPVRYRAVVVLRYVEDLSVPEIAAALGQRPGTVKSLLSRARIQLKEAFDAIDR